ncbi:formyltransferase family protein [Chloroflexota bacterium]
MADNNLLVFSGVNRRYKYLVNKSLDRYPNSSLIIQEITKGDYKGKYDDNDKLDKDVIDLINKHLEVRDEVESKYYEEDSFHLSNCKRVLYVNSETLNSDETVRLIEDVRPSVAFSFGIGMIKEKILNALKNCKTINLHFGLTPYYRGSDTLLWPLYLQNPSHIGITLHQIDQQADHGPIYHQQKTVFSKGDSIHDIFCKTIVQAVAPTLKLIDSLIRNVPLKPYTPPSTGKLFLSGEFTPNHLKIIYRLIDEGMLEKYLAGKSLSKELKAYSCFE